ncbi:MAG: DUF4157 domain-containing protein [Deltaproteobacteria bacterium]|nr:DUF4157 domain-containing protein [Deltaproteobacteria bacterium]
MADHDDKGPGGPEGPDESDLDINLEELSDEIIKRYDPQRLMKTISKRAGRGEPLDWTTRNYFERKLGVDLGDVRVHRGDLAHEVTRQKGAEALTIGTTKQILMSRSGDRSPLGKSGRGLLAHELTHVAQDKKRLHPKSIGEQVFSQADEAEAELAEAEEERAHELGASSGVKPKRGLTEAEYLEILQESIIMRVLELFEGDHMVSKMRLGGSKGKFRP